MRNTGLAAQATAATANGLREIDAHSAGGVPFTNDSFLGMGIYVDDRELAVARALLGRPADEVAMRIAPVWAELTAADAPTERVAELFGIPVGPAPASGERPPCQA